MIQSNILISINKEKKSYVFIYIITIAINSAKVTKQKNDDVKEWAIKSVFILYLLIQAYKYI